MKQKSKGFFLVDMLYLAMTIVPLVAGIIIGVAGLAAAIANYPLHKAILKSRKEKYSAQIIALSEKIINN